MTSEQLMAARRLTLERIEERPAESEDEIFTREIAYQGADLLFEFLLDLKRIAVALEAQTELMP